jgi:hypothetical protein
VRKLYALVKEHIRLESAQQQLNKHAKTIQPSITLLFRADKALMRIVKMLREEFVPRYLAHQGDPLRSAVWATSDELESICYELRLRARYTTSDIHPNLRKPSQVGTGRKSLLPTILYDLDKTTTSGPSQWLYTQLDDLFARIKNGRCLTEMTRMKLISAVCGASGRLVQPTTIKESLRSTKRST